MKNLLKGIAAAFVGILSLGAFKFHQWTQSQRQVIEEAPKLLQGLGEVKTNSNLAALSQKQTQLREAKDNLQAIPDLPGFDYSGAQAQLKQINPVLTSIDDRVNRLNSIDTAVQDAIILDHEALELAKNPPHPADRLNNAVKKWKEAIQYLSDVPKTHATYAQAQAGIPPLKEKLTQAEKWLTAEKLGDRKFEASLKATDEALKLLPLLQPVTGKALQKAQAKLQQSVTFLKEIPAGTTVSDDAEKFLPIAQDNLQRINAAIANLQSCPGGLQSDQCIAQTAPRIDEFPIPSVSPATVAAVPPAAVTSGVTSSGSTVTRYRSYRSLRYPSFPPVPVTQSFGGSGADGGGSGRSSMGSSRSGGRMSGMGSGRSGGGG